MKFDFAGVFDDDYRSFCEPILPARGALGARSGPHLEAPRPRPRCVLQAEIVPLDQSEKPADILKIDQLRDGRMREDPVVSTDACESEAETLNEASQISEGDVVHCVLGEPPK